MEEHTADFVHFKIPTMSFAERLVMRELLTTEIFHIEPSRPTGRVGTMHTPPSLRDPHGTVHRQRGQADLAAAPDRDHPDEFPPLGQASMRAPDRVQRDREK